METLYLPKLNRLHPTIESTVLKVVEEAGELARAVLRHLSVAPIVDPDLLDEVAAELLDVAQTCVTMIFVMEDEFDLRYETLLDIHLAKLRRKGYFFMETPDYRIGDEGSFKVLQLPRLRIPGVDLLMTVCKIQEEIGELTQFLGKGAGASGEKAALDSLTMRTGAALELLDIAQCCFTMMYILAEQYRLNLRPYMEQHEAKLRRKGYFD
jgi:NTP pyrophosphatase (non-canonical NTP hydrolase)